MNRRVRIGLDILAALLALLGLAAVLAVITFDPADPPHATVHPAHDQPANLLGRPGAISARLLVNFAGLGVYPLLMAWLVACIAIGLEGRRGAWCWRFLGLLILTPTVSLGMEWLDWTWYAAPVIGPGGYLGAALGQLAGEYLTNVGIGVTVLACFLCGVALAADSLWPLVLRFAGRRARRYWERRKARGGVPAPATPEPISTSLPSKPKGKKKKDDVDAIPIRHPDVVTPTKEEKALDGMEKGLLAKIQMPAVKKPEPPQISHPARLPDEVPKNAYQLPPFDLLEDPQAFPYELHDQQLRERAVKLEKTFADFELNVRVVGINTGPVITQYEIALQTGLRVNKVTSLGDDLALNLKVPSVRIVAPIPGKDTVGIEIPNEHRAVVRLKEVILNAGPKLQKMKIPLFLGKDTEGRPLIYDLADMPHLLIAGRTGTGKSVCMNAIILSMLLSRRPDEVKMIMIDPKMLELSEYGKIPHLMHPVVKDMRKAEAILSWAVDKMEERYELLSRARVRSIAGYNELTPEEIYRRVNPADDDEKARIPEKMPYIVIFVDEMNDLMMTMRKEVEGHIIRLAQKSRAAGIHLVVATQKPTVDVITGLIKSNLPARICFQVSSRSDSRVVLDEIGAEKLLGKGDMLFLQPGTSTIMRAQGTYASDEEITRVVGHLECEPAYSRELIQLKTSGGSRGKAADAIEERDELYQAAIEVVVREGRGSVSLLQRALGIGYGRAARLIDYMAEDGIVGPYNGSNAREVLVSAEQWAEMREKEGAALE